MLELFSFYPLYTILNPPAGRSIGLILPVLHVPRGWWTVWHVRPLLYARTVPACTVRLDGTLRASGRHRIRVMYCTWSADRERVEANHIVPPLLLLIRPVLEPPEASRPGCTCTVPHSKWKHYNNFNVVFEKSLPSYPPKLQIKCTVTR